MDDRGFLWILHKSNVTLELADALEQEKEIVAFCDNKRMPFMIDVRVDNWNAPKEVREFHATSKPLFKIRQAEAILVNSLGIKILANFYNRFNNPPNPVQVFTDEGEAIEWVLSF